MTVLLLPPNIRLRESSNVALRVEALIGHRCVFHLFVLFGCHGHFGDDTPLLRNYCRIVTLKTCSVTWPLSYKQTVKNFRRSFVSCHLGNFVTYWESVHGGLFAHLLYALTERHGSHVCVRLFLMLPPWCVYHEEYSG